MASMQLLPSILSFIPMLISRTELPSRVVLQNPYLLQEIFQFIEDDPYTLCQAALACRGFRKPAQDVIWRYMDYDLMPLIQLIGNVAFLPSGLEDGDGVWCLNGPITRDDIERVVYFASRVRYISTEEYKSRRISISTYVSLTAALHAQPLFPNLRHIYYTPQPPYPTFILPLLNSPRLRSIEIADSCTLLDTQTLVLCDISTFIQNIKSSPSLETLRISTPPNAPILQTIPTFRNLKHLQLNVSTDPPTTLPLSFLSNLSRLEYLEELNLDGAYFTFTPQECQADLIFPTIRHFLVSSPLPDITALFSFAKFPVLIDLTYEFILPTDPHEQVYGWGALFDSLYGSVEPNVFRELYILPCGDFPHDNVSYLNRQFATLYPGIQLDDIADSLLRFNLSYLSLNFPLFSSLGEDDLVRLMRAFPGLETLDLRCTTERTVGLGALGAIARGLPGLKHLMLDVVVPQELFTDETFVDGFLENLPSASPPFPTTQLALYHTSNHSQSETKSQSTSAPQGASALSSSPSRISNHGLQTLKTKLIGFKKDDVQHVTMIALVVDAMFPELTEFVEAGENDVNEGNDEVVVGRNGGNDRGEVVMRAIKGLQFTRALERRRFGMGVGGAVKGEVGSSKVKAQVSSAEEGVEETSCSGERPEAVKGKDTDGRAHDEAAAEDEEVEDVERVLEIEAELESAVVVGA